MGIFNSFRKKTNYSSYLSDENPDLPVETEEYNVIERDVSSNTTTNQTNITQDQKEINEEVKENKPDTNGEETVLTEEIKEKEEKPVIKHYSGLKTKVISILNQKGGVGKSTTAINLSAALGEKDKHVLLIDLDPQGNTTSGFGIEKQMINKCIYDVLLNDTDIQEVIQKEVVNCVDLVPATINLAGSEVELVSEIAREQRLKEAINKVKGQYDYIFIDCPPSLGLLTVNALVAADELLIPIQCEFYALEGVTKLLDSMKRVKSRLNPSLDIFGVVMTMYDNRTTLSKQVAEEVCSFFGDKVFESKIPRTVKISEAPSFGVPINEYAPLCRGAVMYECLAEEVIERG